MDNFIVSARKYRPATFDMVVGQASITNTLKNAIKNNHLAQAFLFCGPRGVGKTTCARIMAKTINCENLTESTEACNKCKSCVSFNESNSFNVHELDAASNNSVDDIRSLVDQVRIPPHIGKYKVYVIDEVHMLSTAAFNAFLKTLEEPPSYAKFILATTEKHKIIPTILSRCQIFDFNRITINDIAHQLEYVAKSESIETEYEALHIIAQKADGAMRDALSIFDQIVSFAGNKVTYQAVVENLNVLDYDYFFRITDHMLAGETAEILLLYNSILEKGFEGSHFITGFSSHLRNLLMCRDPKTVKLMDVSDTIRAKYSTQASRCQAGFLLKALDSSNKCDLSYRTSNHKRLHVELTLLQITAILHNPDLLAPLQAVPSMATPSPAKTSVTHTATSETTTPTNYSSGDKQSVSQVKESSDSSNQIKANKPETQEPLAQIDVKPINPPAKEPKAASILPGMVNLTQNTEVSDDEKKKDELIHEEGEKRPEDAFNLEDVLQVWEKLKKEYKNSSPVIFSAFNTHQPVIFDEFTIGFGVDNAIQKEQIHEQRPIILSILRKSLNNYALNFRVEIKEGEKIQKAYLPAEKFQKMVEKNPDVDKLRTDLDLDLIY